MVPLVVNKLTYVSKMSKKSLSGNEIIGSLDSLDKTPKVGVFSLGQYGYDTAFSDAVDSQRVYCEKHGYNYYCISEPGSDLLGRENIWLKALACYGALLKNDYILYVDTDVRIKETCPPIIEAVSEENPIGLVAGHSGRANAGVIIAKNCSLSLAFFAEWIACLGKPISPRHDVGWGENGHLIRLVEKYRLELIDTQWNNTFLPDLDDYMRHYTGPIRAEYVFKGEALKAWENIKAAVKVSKASADVDILRSFNELKEVYIRTLDKSLFASFDECWDILRNVVFAYSTEYKIRNSVSRSFHRVYLTEEVSEASQNAYVLTLKNGLDKALGSNNIVTGVDCFWSQRFTSKDVVHIEWVESLFHWNVPSDEQVEHFVNRIQEIAVTTPIVYTAHNFDLMPTIGDKRKILMQALAGNCAQILHLSEANIEAYNRHHSEIVNLSSVPVSIVPHGDYQPYFRAGNSQFEDKALKSEKVKVLVFGHIRTATELEFCLNVADELGTEEYQLIFAGVIHPDLLHWKEIHRFKNEWDGQVRRNHFKVPDDKVIDLVNRSDCMLIPRFDRLNSGVQFLSYTMLKPTFVPAQHSMQDVQNKASNLGAYSPNDPKSAASLIRSHFSGTKSAQLNNMFKTNLFNYSSQDAYAVGAAHEKAYERAFSYKQQTK
ncbi:hypothetical protein SAMN03080615_01988 [Amphritea atlantica]|uniref:Uncharacterized protein n=1 Tax=Amphritea atlantica TaxID=355243 RepID=A0A1H9H7J0_9GAMM|nr:hypothetical protein SAMN03080615_01988 [Amphritea atlantica]